MNELLLQSFQQGKKRCCKKLPTYKIHYKNNETWLVCISCYKLKHWSRYIKSKKEIFKNDN